MAPLAPGSVIGIFGGGQLGRMTALAASRLGYRCHVFAPAADAPAVQVTDRATIAPEDDPAALDAFAAAVDVVTIEFENLPVPSLERLARTVPVHPSPAVLRICQDRLEEKAFLDRHAIPTAPWRPLRREDDLAGVGTLTGPLVLKTARLGYDGKGQRSVDDAGEVGAAWSTLGGVAAIVEQRIAFRRELSVIVARAADGERRSFVPVENRHRDHVLSETIAPAPIDPMMAAEATAIAERIAVALDLTGLVAVEMFESSDGRLLVNELAPRPHNSGHWTIDACPVSQFEQLVRAICALPLGDPDRALDATMTNLLGHDVDEWPSILREPGARLHLYGKREARPGRKLGHVTRTRPKAG